MKAEGLERAADRARLVDNASIEPGLQTLRDEHPEARFLASPVNRGSAGGNNLGIAAALADGSDAILLLNNDATLSDEAVASMMATLSSDPGIGVVGPTLWDTDRFVLEPAAEVLHKGQGSGMSRGLYVRLVTRNRLTLFAKSVPLSLLFRNIGRLLYGQLYFFLAYRRPFQSVAGYVTFLRLVPHVLRERRRLKGRAESPRRSCRECWTPR